MVVRGLDRADRCTVDAEVLHGAKQVVDAELGPGEGTPQEDEGIEYDHGRTLSRRRKIFPASTRRSSSGERPARRTFSTSSAGLQPGPSLPKIMRSAPRRRTASPILSGEGTAEVSSTMLAYRSATAIASSTWKSPPIC